MTREETKAWFIYTQTSRYSILVETGPYGHPFYLLTKDGKKISHFSESAPEWYIQKIVVSLIMRDFVKFIVASYAPPNHL